MRVGIDLDGCAYPFVEEFTAYASQRLGVKLPPFTHWNSHQKHWGLSHNQLTELMSEALHQGFLWSAGTPIAGFAEATWELSELGHIVIIATDRMQATDDARLAKTITRDWLYKVHANYDELIFTADKRDARADVFIEDRPQAVPMLILAGVDAVYMDRPWNTSFPYPRVHSWSEFVAYVEERSNAQAS